jgi:hypothetical protein
MTLLIHKPRGPKMVAFLCVFVVWPLSLAAIWWLLDSHISR